MKTVAKIAAVALLASALASIVDGAEYLLLVGAAAAIHEAGHILISKLLRVPSCGGGNSFFGLSLKFDFSSVSYFKEIAVSSGGAVFNLAACALTVLFTKNAGAHAVFFVFSNLSLALFNLLPVSPLDGAGIIRAILSMVASPRFADRAATALSVAVSLAFFMFCIYVQMKIGANLSLMFVSVYLLYNALADIRKLKYENEP